MLLNFIMTTIIMTETTLNKKQGFKNAYKEVEKEVKEITRDQHNKITNEDTCKWFRRLGGSETLTRAYTCDGYKCVKLVSTSPDKQIKKIREFKFSWKD